MAKLSRRSDRRVSDIRAQAYDRDTELIFEAAAILAKGHDRDELIQAADRAHCLYERCRTILENPSEAIDSVFLAAARVLRLMEDEDFDSAVKFAKELQRISAQQTRIHRHGFGTAAQRAQLKRLRKKGLTRKELIKFITRTPRAARAEKYFFQWLNSFSKADALALLLDAEDPLLFQPDANQLSDKAREILWVIDSQGISVTDHRILALHEEFARFWENQPAKRNAINARARKKSSPYKINRRETVAPR